jgi:pSer/pThr/pTyr-binding forkhead associated (FHA) protein
MNQLDRLEALAQRLIEGAFHRFFQTQLPSAVQMEQKIETKEVLSLANNDVAARWVLQLEDRLIKLGEPVVNIGRALDNDIILSDPAVSRYHAQLRWREGRYHLCPPERSLLASAMRQPSGRTKQTKRLSAHTMVNYRAVDQAPLNPGDLLTLGGTSLKIILEGAET